MSMNQQAQQVQQAQQAVALAMEQAVTDELSHYDSLLEDDDALARLRAQRLKQLQQAATQRQAWLSAGHGVYTEWHTSQDSRDVANAFFDAAKASPRLVVHFYRNSTADGARETYHEVVDRLLEQLARQHVETRFCKINVQDCEHQHHPKGAAFLVDRLSIRVLPTLLLVRNRAAIHQIQGLDEFPGGAQATVNQVRAVLRKYDMVDPNSPACYDDDDDDDDDDCNHAYDRETNETPKRNVNAVRLNKSTRTSRYKYEDGEAYD